jgi:hypothetical protein
VTGANSRGNAKKVLVLVSDGSTSNNPNPLSAAAQLAANRLHIHTITVGSPNVLMRQLIVGDGRNYVVPTPASSPLVTYNDMLHAQHASCRGKKGPGDLQKLFREADTWKIG